MAISQAERLSKRKASRLVWPKLKKSFQCRVREERQRLGLSMRDMVKRCGVNSSSSLSRMENGGDVCLSTAFELAEFFGKNITDLWTPLNGK